MKHDIRIRSARATSVSNVLAAAVSNPTMVMIIITSWNLYRPPNIRVSALGAAPAVGSPNHFFHMHGFRGAMTGTERAIRVAPALLVQPKRPGLSIHGQIGTMSVTINASKSALARTALESMPE